VRVGEVHAFLHQACERRCRLLIDHSRPQPVGDKQNYVVWLLGETRSSRDGTDHYYSQHETKSSIVHHHSPIMKLLVAGQSGLAAVAAGTWLCSIDLRGIEISTPAAGSVWQVRP
jgi:hypothetical protein